MRHASLFTGIGGFDLAAEWMGWENIFQCEIDPWCQKLLKQNFPNVHYRYGDIKQTDFTHWAGRIDVLTGGFPCQPYSTAGKRLGKDDERHLWPEYLRAIREIRPAWVVGENVRGLISWNGGVVFDEVQADLEAEGYEVLPFLLPAAGVNAPHRRDRIWFLAFMEDACSLGFRESGILSKQQGGTEPLSTGENRVACEREELEDDVAHSGSIIGGKEWPESARQQGESRSSKGSNEASSYPLGDGHGIAYRPDQNRRSAGKDEGKAQRKYGERLRADLGRIDAAGIAANPNSDKRSERGLYTYRPGEATGYTSPCGAWASGRTWENFPTQPPVCGRNDGVPNRVDRLKGLGNAVVPQVVLQIFKAIEQYELLRIPA